MHQSEWEATIAWSKVVVGCVIQNDNGEYLLVQEMQEKCYGLWNLPAGYVDKGETIEAAAVREVKEETGYDAELLDKINIYHEAIDTPVRHAFRAKVIGGDAKPQPDEILDVKWFSYDQIVQMHNEGKLRVEWIFDAITTVEKS